MATRHYLATLLFSATLAVPLATHAADPLYTVTVVGSANSYAGGINNAGAVVGIFMSDPSFTSAFVNYGSGMVNIGTLGGAASYAARINDAGQVAGFSQTSAGQTHAFLYSGGAMTDLGTFGGSYSYAFGINATGSVAGYAARTPSPDPSIELGPRAFVRPPGGSLQDIGALPFPNPYSQANDINNSGQVVGSSGPFGAPDPASYPFLYSGGVMTNLGNIGGDFNAATAINDLGQVVGYVSLPGSILDRHAFLYLDGVLIDLDQRPGESHSSATDINNLGQVVGGSDHLGAFLYRGAGLESLNTMIDPASGWNLTSAAGINEHGQISATGTRDGQYFAVRLDPVSEPATVVMLLAGLGLVWALKRRGSGTVRLPSRSAA